MVTHFLSQMERLSTHDFKTVTRHLRAMYASRLLVAAVCHLKAFEYLADGPLTETELARRIGLKARPAKVLFPALRAMGMITGDASGRLALTEDGNCLVTRTPGNLIGYVGLEANEQATGEMAERLLNDGPRHARGGTAFVKESAEESPMDNPVQARLLTLALAGRARQLSPRVAEALPRQCGHLLDVAGGTGLFAYEWLRLNLDSTATVLDRPQVLQVAGEFLDEFCNSGREGAASVRTRVKLEPGNMLEDELPRADLILAASLFHDWPETICQQFAEKLAQTLKPGGELWVHDAFLNDAMDGPIEVTDYSTQLFWVTKGRCYSRAEFRRWFADAGLAPTRDEIPTAMDYGLISARR